MGERRSGVLGEMITAVSEPSSVAQQLVRPVFFVIVKTAKK